MSLNHVEIIDPSAAWLMGQQRNDTSQFGEDGLIQAVLAHCGESNRWCFEVGAADGLFFSNTKRLRDLGWHAVLIEADGRLADVCRRWESNKVKVIHERISGNLDAILSRCGAPADPDLGVIDIDGQDYWEFKTLVSRPRVLLVEFMYVNENMTDPAFIPPPGGDGQAGFEAIVGLGRDKGYTAIAKTFCNVLFVDKAVWESN
jgi:hypothetical protein